MMYEVEYTIIENHRNIFPGGRSLGTFNTIIKVKSPKDHGLDLEEDIHNSLNVLGFEGADISVVIRDIVPK